MPTVIDTLVELSRTLGEPARDLVILAEGNTSIRTDADRMLVKASGSQLGTAAGEDFVEVRIQPMLDLVHDEKADDPDVERLFGELARIGKRPSVEAMLHYNYSLATLRVDKFSLVNRSIACARATFGLWVILLLLIILLR